MRGVILAIIGLILILFVSYIAISEEGDSFILKTFVVDGNMENVDHDYDVMTYEVGQGVMGGSERRVIYDKTNDARKRNLEYERREEEIERCIEKKTKNWERTYSARSFEKEFDEDKNEWVITDEFFETEDSIFGYNKDEDWRFYWRLRNRALNGGGIC